MRRSVRHALTVGVLLLAAYGCGSERPSSDGLKVDSKEVRTQVEKAIAKVYPALVQIHVVYVDYSEGRELKEQAAGSGAIISAEGHVITNHHVAGKAKRIRCTLANKEEIEARLVGTDPLADIAIVKLDLSSRKKNEPLPVAEFGDSDKLRVSDRVLAMGCPVALSQSVTMGIVSNLGFTIPKLFWPFTFKLEGEEVGTVVKWIGHDAQIFGGNSGGPLVDLEGKIVGINEIGIGLGGAIPANVAKDVAQQIIKNGKVERSWVGLLCQPLLKGQDSQGGALVSEVLENSPASAAGIKPGDILASYDGKPVSIRFAEEIPDFNRRVLSTPVGATVPVTVLRDGKRIETKLTTTLREPARGEERELKAWGVTARQITDPVARELKRADKAGAYVWSVRPGGPAGDAKPNIVSEDVIVQVDGKPIQGLAHLVEVTEALVKGKDKPVPTVVAFDRKNQRMLTVVKLGISKDEDKAGDVQKAWLPAAYQVLTTDLAESLKLKNASGVRITQVYPRSAAEEAGLKVGDIVTHLDGQRVMASQPEDMEVFPQMIREYKIGTIAEFSVVRLPATEPLKMKVKMVGRPKPEAEMKRHKDDQFDFEVRDITYMDRVKEGWDESQAGAMVMAVQPGGWAALAHLGVGDLILSIDNTAIRNVAALEAAMKAIAEKRPRHVTFFVKRGIHSIFVEMEPAWPAK